MSAEWTDRDEEMLRAYPLSPGITWASRVFKGASVAALIATAYVLAALWHPPNTSPSGAWWVRAGIIAGGIVLASAFAFFGYVLDLLDSIERNSRR